MLEDKFQRIVNECDVAVAVFGNEATSDFALVPLDAPELDEETFHSFAVRQLAFLGVIGLQTQELKPRVELNRVLHPASQAILTGRFVAAVCGAMNLIAGEVRAAESSRHWLENLHALPDLRTQPHWIN
jgi:hypothetical protein